jgi:hypothetical protein
MLILYGDVTEAMSRSKSKQQLTTNHMSEKYTLNLTDRPSWPEAPKRENPWDGLARPVKIIAWVIAIELLISIAGLAIFIPLWLATMAQIYERLNYLR